MTSWQGAYDKGLSRQYPGLFVILLDQSYSMKELVEGTNDTKANIAATHVNTIIQEMIHSAGVEEMTGDYKKYAYLSVIGYNDNVYPLLSQTDVPVDIPTLARNPRGNVTQEQELRNQAGTVIRRITHKRPFWVEPRASGNTNMTLAFETAKSVVHSWLNSRPEFISKDMGYQKPRQESFPPVIINVTDAKDTTPGRNTLAVTEEIRRMCTNNGNVLIFNCHFAEKGGNERLFPNDINQVRHLDERGFAANLYLMSSQIPDILRQRAIKLMQEPIEAGARCMVYNANPDILIRFLRWSTNPELFTATGAA